jgi:hypothetical protein
MPRRSAAKAAATPPARFELGGYWLWYRANRDDWAICWLDGCTTRRVQTGVGGGSSGHPPEAAKERLAEFVLEQKAKRSALVASAPEGVDGVALSHARPLVLAYESAPCQTTACTKGAEELLVANRTNRGLLATLAEES